jgi:nicotinamide-nucleotide amidase
VAPALLDAHGPVSEATAVALASGARSRLGTDVGLGVVGVAGPDPQGGRPVGTICVGVALPDGATHGRTIELPPRSRADMQEFAASITLDLLRRRLAEDPSEQ